MFSTVDSIVKSFSKLEEKLDKHISTLTRRDAQLELDVVVIDGTRKELQAENARALRIKNNIQKLIK